MINFTMMLNLNKVKSQSNSLFSSSSKITNLSKNLEFENMMIKKEPLFNNDANINSSNFSESLEENIEINLKDKEVIIADLEERLNDDYTKEDLVNIMNLYLAINLTSEKESLKIDSVEFIDITDELVSKENPSEEDVFGVFKLKDGVLSVPLVTNILEKNFTKVSEMELKPEVENIKNINLEGVEPQGIEINTENFIIVNGTDSNYIEKMFREFENVSKIDIYDKNSDYIKIFKEIESIVQFNQRDSHVKVNAYEKLNTEKSGILESNLLDVFNKKDNGLIKIDEEFNLKKIEFKDINTTNQIKSEISKFSDFLANQRISNMKVETLNINDKDIGILMEILDSESNIDVANLISPDTYGLESNINDTIKSNVVPESIRQSFIEKDITQVIQYLKGSDINKLTLKVNPKELGEITINLVKNGDISDVVITVEREELFNSVKKNLIGINKELKDLGLKINNISIEMKQNNTANSTFDFMSNSHKDDSKNHSGNYQQQDRKMKKSRNAVDDIEISSVKMSKNEVESEINLLA